MDKRIKILPEVLMNNRLEKDIQKMMFPVHLMFSIFLASKYTIKDDYVTPKGRVYRIFTFVFVAVLFGMTVNRLFFEGIEDTLGLYNFDLVSLFYIYFCFFYLTLLAILFYLNMIHSEANISLILLIQKIYLGLDFSDNLKIITRRNWMGIVGTFLLNIFLQYLFYTTFDEFHLIDTILDFMFTIFDLNLVYSLLVLLLLRRYLEKWIKLVLGDFDDKTSVKLFIIYRNIMEAYNHYKTTFKLLIMFHTVDTFTRCLFYFTMALQKLRMLDNVEDDKRDLQQSVTVVLSVVWLSKNIFVLVMHSVLGEKFYITIEEAETACIQRLKNRNYFEYEGVLCKEVVQLNRVSFSKLDAFGLFHIDGTLPLHFAGIVTNYIVLILQTMFL